MRPESSSKDLRRLYRSLTEEYLFSNFFGPVRAPRGRSDHLFFDHEAVKKEEDHFFGVRHPMSSRNLFES